MGGYLISLTFIEHQNHNRVRTRTLGSNCRHTNSVPNTDDMEQISMSVLLKLQNRLRAEPLSIGTYLVNKQDNLSKGKNGIFCKSTDYRLYFKNPHISLSSCEGQFLVPHYYQTVYRVYLLLSCSAGKVLSYRNIFFFLWVTTYLEVQAETGRKEEVWGKATFLFTLSGSSPIDGHQSLHSLQSLDSLILHLRLMEGKNINV